jgi:hypothetical protein
LDSHENKGLEVLSNVVLFVIAIWLLACIVSFTMGRFRRRVKRDWSGHHSSGRGVKKSLERHASLERKRYAHFQDEAYLDPSARLHGTVDRGDQAPTLEFGRDDAERATHPRP